MKVFIGLFAIFAITSASFVNHYLGATHNNRTNHPNPEFPYQTVLNVDKSLINLTYAADIWAGYMPADDKGSLIYYHLYPANGLNDSSANLNNSLPLIMWMQGGPGCTDWVGLFNENGPYTIVNVNGQNVAQLTAINWNQGYNLLYIDQPVPVGFSVAGKGVVITNSMEAAAYMQTFLVNFFNIYTSLKSNQFYIFGESFAGHYIPSLASTLVQSGSVKVDGIAIGDGLVNPYWHAITWAPYGLAAGVIDTQGMSYLATLGNDAQAEFNQSNWNAVSNIFNDILGYLSNTSETGVVNIEDYRSESSDTPAYYGFVAETAFRNAYGIDPSVIYSDCDATVGSDFTDVGESYAANITYLLNNNIPVMIYQGQDDLLINTPGTRKWVDNLEWSGITRWQATETKILSDDSGVIGTYKHSGLFTFVVVNKAGHMVPHYQPETAQIIVNKFIEQKW